MEVGGADAELGFATAVHRHGVAQTQGSPREEPAELPERVSALRGGHHDAPAAVFGHGRSVGDLLALAHAQLVVDALGVKTRTIDISPAVDGYLSNEPDADPARRGNVMARERMIVLFDQSAKCHALPVGTGNKTERLLGYFTWHADDSPPINPLGDLFKTQVFTLAKHLGIPSVIVDKPPTADLVHGQTDEGDFGISYAKADEILNWIVSGYVAEDLVAHGFDAAEVELVRKRLDGTHWKRRMPTVAMLRFPGESVGSLSSGVTPLENTSWLLVSNALTSSHARRSGTSAAAINRFTHVAHSGGDSRSIEEPARNLT